MKYTIKFNYNGKEYENIYVPTTTLDISTIMYEAFWGSLRMNNLELENACVRNIELFQENQHTPIYSAITYTSGMGFIIMPENE